MLMRCGGTDTSNQGRNLLHFCPYPLLHVAAIAENILRYGIFKKYLLYGRYCSLDLQQ